MDQNQWLEILQEYIQEKYALYKFLFKQEQKRLFPDNTHELSQPQEQSVQNQLTTLIWSKSDTDLLELIVALVRSGSIENFSGKTLSLKDAILGFTHFFNFTVKDIESKLSKARRRKKDAPFLTNLKHSFDLYKHKIVEK